MLWLNNDEPPESVRLAADSWREHAPQLLFDLWTRSALAERYGRQLLAVKVEPFVLSNLLRAKLLFDFGGFYVDADAYAQPGAGPELAAVLAQSTLVSVPFAGGRMQYDNTPIGAVAGLPGWEAMERDPRAQFVHWNQFLASRPHTVLPGDVWNAPEAGPGVRIVHRRGTLTVAKDRRDMRPALPRLVVQTKGERAALQRAKQKAANFAAMWPTRATLGELLNLHGLTGRGVEVGTHRGDFAAQLLETWRGDKLTCVDSWEFTVFDAVRNAQSIDREADLAEATRRLARFGDRVELRRASSPAAAEAFADGSLDFVYLDGDHTRPAVDCDLFAWWQKIRVGGMFAGHDLTGAWGANVRAAVASFAKHFGLQTFATEDEPASWFLFRV